MGNLMKPVLLITNLQPILLSAHQPTDAAVRFRLADPAAPSRDGRASLACPTWPCSTRQPNVYYCPLVAEGPSCWIKRRLLKWRIKYLEKGGGGRGIEKEEKGGGGRERGGGGARGGGRERGGGRTG